MWTGACVLIVAAAAVMLWNNIEIPRDWIPSRWSDFQFWSDKFRELEEKVRLFLMLPKTVLQAENISGFVKCVGCSMGSAFIGILALLSKKGKEAKEHLHEKIHFRLPGIFRYPDLPFQKNVKI